MKKALAFLFLSVLLMSVVSVSLADLDPLYVSKHYTLFIDARIATSGKARLFDFDSLCVDLYMMDGDQRAYLSVSKSFSGIFIASGTVAVNVVENNGTLFFASDDGNYTTGRYDENGEDIWLDLEGRTFRLRPVPTFSVYDDWK